MGCEEGAFSGGWYYVCMMCDSFGGTRNLEIKLSSEVVVPRKRTQSPCSSGKPGMKKRI